MPTLDSAAVPATSRVMLSEPEVAARPARAAAHLPAEKHRRPMLLKRPDVFLSIFSSEQATEFGLQCGEGQLLAVAERLVHRGEGCADTKRRGRGDSLRHGHCTIELLTRGSQLLHETHAVCVIGVPLVAGQRWGFAAGSSSTLATGAICRVSSPPGEGRRGKAC